MTSRVAEDRAPPGERGEDRVAAATGPRASREPSSLDENAPLGVVAGDGVLPRLVAEAAARAGGGAYVVALRGAAGDWVRDWPHTICGVGQVGKLFARLKAAGCRQVCLAGGLSRPSYWGLRFDMTALRVALRVARLMRRGDDGLMRGLATIFEERGFELIGARALLSDLLAPEGVIGARAPSARDLEDVGRAAAIVEALGTVDVGQGAVVARGRCLAVETIQGTDAMLRGLIGAPRAGAPNPSGALFKAPKPGQDMRLDVPAIGPNTLREAKAAGLNGVAVAAGGVFLLDVAETIAVADQAGLFLYGWTPDAGETAP